MCFLVQPPACPAICPSACLSSFVSILLTFCAVANLQSSVSAWVHDWHLNVQINSFLSVLAISFAKPQTPLKMSVVQLLRAENTFALPLRLYWWVIGTDIHSVLGMKNHYRPSFPLARFLQKYKNVFDQRVAALDKHGSAFVSRIDIHIEENPGFFLPYSPPPPHSTVDEFQTRSP